MKLRQMLLSVAVFIISLQLSAQDLIYKKGGEIVKAKILTKSGKSISFKHFEPTDSLTYFLNVAAIDSIISQNGVKETFVKNIDDNHPLARNPNPTYNHHLIGIDLAGFLLYRNLVLSYEFLPGKAKLGFKAAFAKNMGPWQKHAYVISYGTFGFNINRYTDWNARLGINYYFFPPQTFRFGTGVYYIFGPNTNKYTPYTVVYEKNNLQGLMLSFFGYYNIRKNLAINLGSDFPLYINYQTDGNSKFMIRCEILLNF